MSEQPQDLTTTMQEMMAQMARMQAELDSLKARAQVLPQPAPQTKPQVSTTRRKMLGRLAGALGTVVAVGAGAALLPQNVEARFVAAKGWGAIVVPPGGTITGNTPSGTVYGLYATSDATTNIGSYLQNYKIGVVGLNTSSASGSKYYGVYGEAYDVGVYGKSSSTGVTGEGYRGIIGLGAGVGVTGEGNSWGVYGYSSNGVGIYAVSGIGATPFSIAPGSQPSVGIRNRGDIYVDNYGNMHIYNGTEWRTVTTTAG